MEKKGTILAENIIFIVLNLVFIMILFFFIFLKSGGAAVLEEKYAKKIALIIDSARPGMEIHLDMEDAIKTAEKEKFPLGQIVSIRNNILTVKLREKGGYSYSFFNDVEVNVNPDLDKREYYFVISKKQ